MRLFILATFSSIMAPTAALANKTDTLLGPYLPSPSQAVAAAQAGSENICASYGGLQSFTVHSIVQNGGYYAAYFTYVCNS